MAPAIIAQFDTEPEAEAYLQALIDHEVKGSFIIYDDRKYNGKFTVNLE